LTSRLFRSSLSQRSFGEHSQRACVILHDVGIGNKARRLLDLGGRSLTGLTMSSEKPGAGGEGAEVRNLLPLVSEKRIEARDCGLVHDARFALRAAPDVTLLEWLSLALLPPRGGRASAVNHPVRVQLREERTMRKWLAVFTTVVLSVVACGGTSEEPNQPDDDENVNVTSQALTKGLRPGRSPLRASKRARVGMRARSSIGTRTGHGHAVGRLGPSFA
jgi:hypothetical protein